MAYRRCPKCWEKHGLQETVCISCGRSLVMAEVFREVGDESAEMRPGPVITERSAGNVTILEFEGLFIDEAAAERIQRCISGLLERGGRQILVDLGKVPAMDMSCIDKLVVAFTQVARAGGAMRLMNASKRIGQFRLDGIAKLFAVFELFECESDALRSFDQAEE